MTQMFRLIQPSRIGEESSAMKVHYESPDGGRLLCSQGDVVKVIDGDRMRIWYRTKREVTCRSCTKAFEMIVRRQLRGLTGDQLEDIAAHIATFSMRNGRPA